MDICMMRDDYEKFCKIAPQALGKEFFWQTKDTDPAFFPEYGKVRLNGTLWEENILSRSPIAHKGLFVDIFPMDPFPENAKTIRYLDRKSKLYSAVLNYKIHKIVSPKPVNAMIQHIVSAFTTGKNY
jgi:phosphorylcholine metabolism protein LicD